MKHLRTVATGVATLALGAALAAWGGAAQAQDKSKQVYFLSWGGTIQTMLEKEGWADQFAKDTGYTVTLVPKATSGESIATAVAQKEKPQVDVVMCTHLHFDHVGWNTMKVGDRFVPTFPNAKYLINRKSVV